ncbi:MAG: hypothetical protein H7A01_15300 [Hahellaceae bacterium]|nr:hypothetical protein [Hahellaceae bacterium]MCP5210428.1 hypothetical protein [Hahellaceae bacterium]
MRVSLLTVSIKQLESDFEAGEKRRKRVALWRMMAIVAVPAVRQVSLGD